MLTPVSSIISAAASICKECNVIHLTNIYAGLTAGLTLSSGAAWSAGFLLSPTSPFFLLSRLLRTHSATSLSSVPDLMSGVAGVPPSSSASIMVTGFDNGANQPCWRSMAYVGRSFGILFKQPRTKSRARGENPSSGRSGGSPSTIA